MSLIVVHLWISSTMFPSQFFKLLMQTGWMDDWLEEAPRPLLREQQPLPCFNLFVRLGVCYICMLSSADRKNAQQKSH